MMKKLRTTKFKMLKCIARYKRFSQHLPLIDRVIRKHEMRRIYRETAWMLRPDGMDKRKIKELVETAVRCTTIAKEKPVILHFLANVAVFLTANACYYRSVSLGIGAIISSLLFLILRKMFAEIELARMVNFGSGFYGRFSVALSKGKDADQKFLQFKQEWKKKWKLMFFYPSFFHFFHTLSKHAQAIFIFDKSRATLSHEFTHFFLTNISDEKTRIANFLATSVGCIYLTEEVEGSASLSDSDIEKLQSLIGLMIRAEIYHRERKKKFPPFFLTKAFDKKEENEIDRFWGENLAKIIENISKRKFSDGKKRRAFEKECMRQISNAFYYYRKYGRKPAPLVCLIKKAEKKIAYEYDLKTKDK